MAPVVLWVVRGKAQLSRDVSSPAPDLCPTSPFHFAAFRGYNIHVAGVLIDNGSDETAVDKKGRTVLHLAQKTGSEK